MGTFDWENATREMLVTELRRRYREGNLDELLFSPPVQLRRLIAELYEEMAATPAPSRWN